MVTFIAIIKASVIFLGLLLGIGIICATIWAIFDWLFNREWSWTDKFIIMLEFWLEVLCHSSHHSYHHRSSSSGFKGGGSRGGGVGRSF